MPHQNIVSAEKVSKILCVVLLLLQSCILDYYLVENKSLAWIGFVFIDIVVVALWVIALIVAYKQNQRKTSHDHSSTQTTTSSPPDELRVAYVAWFVYAVGYTIEISLVFKYFDRQLSDSATSKVFGQNVLKCALTLTPMLFLLLVHAHHDAAPNSRRKFYIEGLTGGVTIDLMDSIEILEILFEEPEKVHLPGAFENCVIAFACINVFLPTLALLELKQSKFSGQRTAFISSKILYHFSYVFLVNLPYFIIRVILWAKYDQDVSVFLAKNIILIVLNLWDVYEFFTFEHAANTTESNVVVLQDQRPSENLSNGGQEQPSDNAIVDTPTVNIEIDCP